MSGELFTENKYLDALHRDAAAAPSGWTSVENEALTYLKTHSWGEFVFDFEFAKAYQQAGMAYYPKLLCAVPFTPVIGPRLFGRDGEYFRALCAAHSASSAHLLFLSDHERVQLADEGWLPRCDIRFVWRDQDYGDFDGFLSALSSKPRKNIRRERRKIAESELQLLWRSAAEITGRDWTRIYQLYASTYHMRGQQPYLNEACLVQWGNTLAGSMLFCLAIDDQKNIMAMAMFFRDSHNLYGRHWGAAMDVDALHFELCYYQGIEYCLANGIGFFDAGVQGSHRLQRGFEPVLSHSAHHFVDERFHQMISNYLAREQQAVTEYHAELRHKTAFRQD